MYVFFFSLETAKQQSISGIFMIDIRMQGRLG